MVAALTAMIAHVTIAKTSLIETLQTASAIAMAVRIDQRWPKRELCFTPLAVPHHGVMAAMVVLGVEVANGKDSQWDADHCQHEKGKDGHATLPGNAGGESDPPVFPQYIKLQKELRAVSDLGITSRRGKRTYKHAYPGTRTCPITRHCYMQSRDLAGQQADAPPVGLS